MKIYIVQREDTFEKIAYEHNVDLDVLIRANPQIAKTDMILSGMKIKLPQKRKQVKKNIKKPSKSNASKQKKSRDIADNERYMPIIEEDDTWDVQLTLPERIAVKNDFVKQKTNPLIKTKKKSKDVSYKNNALHTIRHNPISDIRKTPIETIPEVNVLQVVP